MSRCLTLVLAAGMLVAGLAAGPAIADPEPSAPKGQNCRMEQQCKWVNFKKVCTWVKVCR
jgi:hypothetical protein